MATKQSDDNGQQENGAGTETGDFRLRVRSYEKNDDGNVTASEEVYTRREWSENGPQGAGRDLWSTLAEQSYDQTDLRDSDTMLVGIRVMGYIEDFGETVGISPGYDGPEWTMATVNRYGDVADPENDEYPGPPQADPPEQWAHEPVFEGWEPCVSFQSVYHTTRDRFQAARYTHDYPKAAGLLVVYPEGTPTRLDRETLSRTDGLPEDEDGKPVLGGEWDYDRAVETARERVERKQAMEAHEVDTSGIEALADEYPPQVAIAALGGKRDGSRRYGKVSQPGETAGAFTEDALSSAASGAVERLLDQLPEETREDVMEALADGDEEEGDTGDEE
jgi:hypothetical protein